MTHTVILHAELFAELFADCKHVMIHLPVIRPNRIALANFLKSVSIRVTSAVSIAATVPVAPIAIPTVANANAGASFTPSPTIPTQASSSLLCALKPQQALVLY